MTGNRDCFGHHRSKKLGRLLASIRPGRDEDNHIANHLAWETPAFGWRQFDITMPVRNGVGFCVELWTTMATKGGALSRSHPESIRCTRNESQPLVQRNRWRVRFHHLQANHGNILPGGPG
jgi:hypothetical protein